MGSRGSGVGSRAYGRHEIQGVILKCTRQECSVFVNLRPHLLRIRSRHQFSSPKKIRLPLRDSGCGICCVHSAVNVNFVLCA